MSAFGYKKPPTCEICNEIIYNAKGRNANRCKRHRKTRKDYEKVQ